jgi:hypothetical protein
MFGGLFYYGYQWWIGRTLVGDREIKWIAGRPPRSVDPEDDQRFFEIERQHAAQLRIASPQMGTSPQGVKKNRRAAEQQ